MQDESSLFSQASHRPDLAESSPFNKHKSPHTNSEPAEQLCLKDDGKKHRQSHIGPIWPFFQPQKNHKPLTFSRKIRGLCLYNVAVKKRFETTRERILETSPTAYKGCSLVACVESVPA